MLAKEGIAWGLGTTLVEMGIGPEAFIPVVGLVPQFVGMWLEIGAVTVILAPTLATIAETLGIPAYQFRTTFVVTLKFGLSTPPLGIRLFATSSVSDRSVWAIGKQVLPFYVADIFVLLSIIFIAQLRIMLPSAAGG
ncbi:TRAP transporter large permease subunit [Haloarcula nitratireducens]|nr:TRAP transporter large permease subunit [Halomicroarcula nitratireducens]